MEIRKTDIFAKWLNGLDDIRACARILVLIERLAAGNPGDVKPVGGRVSELRVNYGPGWRAVISAPRPTTSKPACGLLAICRNLS